MANWEDEEISEEEWQKRFAELKRENAQKQRLRKESKYSRHNYGTVFSGKF